MPVRKKTKIHTSQPTDQSVSRPSADPFAEKEKGESAILKISKFMQDLFSHKGMFWLGVTIATVCFAGNFWFYFTIVGNLTDYALWQRFGLAALASCTTTLFELMPVVMQRGRRNTLHQIFLAGSKPRDLPELNPKIVGDADALVKQYRNSDKETREFFETARWIAVFIETTLGVIFLGSIGTGIGALIRLMLFIASIFGCEWGVTLALRAAEWELPPKIRKQLDDLIANAGNPLGLRRI